MSAMKDRGSGGQPLYRQIAAEIADLIEREIVRPGERLPSVRELSLSKAVSIPTIQEAFRVLEDLHLIEVRPQSGHFALGKTARSQQAVRPRTGPFVGRPTEVRTSRIGRAIEKTLRAERGFEFAAAIPEADFFPLRRLNTILGQHLRQTPGLLGLYTFSPGDLGLRREIARRAVDWDCALDPESLVVTNGCTEAVSLCLRAIARPGDVIAVESPCYYGFLHLLEALDLRALEIPCHPTDGMSLEDLEDALGLHPIRACLMSTTVSNPTGATMPADNKRRLVAMLASKGIPLIEDATFADLHRAGPAPAAQSFDETGGVLLCASLTKTVAPGSRLGWAHPGRFLEQVSFLKRTTSVDQPDVLQRALASYLVGGGCDRHLRRLRRDFGDRVQRARAVIAETFPAGTRLTVPSGGFLLWVELPANIAALSLQQFAIDVGIGAAPGVIFSTSDEFAHFMRINVAVHDVGQMTKGLTLLGERVRELAA
jgi:DNA-binding transcriptional MocR family regulator